MVGIVIDEVIVEDTFLLLLTITPLLNLHRDRQSPDLNVRVFLGNFIQLLRDGLVDLL